jgi:hypothetical protein
MGLGAVGVIFITTTTITITTLGSVIVSTLIIIPVYPAQPLVL